MPPKKNQRRPRDPQDDTTGHDEDPVDLPSDSHPVVPVEEAPAKHVVPVAPVNWASEGDSSDEDDAHHVDQVAHESTKTPGFFRQVLTRAQALTPDSTTIIELHSVATQLDKMWELFQKQHEAFASVCSSSFLHHAYMTEGVYEQGLTMYDSSHQHYAKLRSRLARIANSANSPDSPIATLGLTHQQNLPEIKLPTFTGDYSSWPPFKDLFNSLIIENASLSKVEKMHYLKTCVEGSAAQLISTLPVAGDSFDSAWTVLTSRYENKRLLISTHLDKLFGLKPLPARSATAMQALLTTTTEALNALETLGSPVEQWDQLLVHLLAQKLDTPTREAWENKLGSSTEFPSFSQLKTFLVGRARALERLEASPTESQSTHQRNSRSNSRTAHNAVVAPRSALYSGSSASYPCDCCQEKHYVTMCPKFRELSPSSRKKLVDQQRLCFNCFGHHSARACNSARTCRTCGERHHTMIHGTSRGQEPARTKPVNSTD